MASETQKHFIAIAGQLDTIIEQITPFLVSQRIVMRDRSNRSGHYDTFRSWCFDFEQREYGSLEIKSVKISISYDEPVELPTEDALTIRTTAERFIRGKESHWKHVDGHSVPVSQVTESRLKDEIVAQLRAATNTLKRSAGQGVDFNT